MTEHPKPTITVNVDVTNPGQFFACCGLLELADRLWPGAEGWFADAKFHMSGCGTTAEILRALIAHEAEQVTSLQNGLAVKPLIAPLKLSFDGERPFTLVLDAWITIKVEKGNAVAAANPPWNFWSGQQTSYRIWRDLRNVLVNQLTTLAPEQVDNLFVDRVFLSGRFGFDPGAAWNALDVGFSPNEQSMQVASSPSVEMLAAVGIQRFRPNLADDRESFTYATWGQPLAPSVAVATASGAIVVPPSQRFRGRVISRGSYAALGHSTLLKGETHE